MSALIIADSMTPMSLTYKELKRPSIVVFLRRADGASGRKTGRASTTTTIIGRKKLIDPFRLAI